MPHARDDSLLSSGNTVLEPARRLPTSAIHLERGCPTGHVGAVAEDKARQAMAREAVVLADAGQPSTIEARGARFPVTKAAVRNH